MRELARWPLLLGVGLLLAAAIYLAPEADDGRLALALLLLAAVILGAWLALYASGDRDPHDTPDDLEGDDVGPLT